jgi:Fe-S cluster assembly iron-binding protein IscA
MLTLTEKAVEQLKETIAKQDSPNTVLRVSFGGFG